MTTRLTKNEKAALATAGILGGGLLLAWLVTGVGKEKNSPLVPDAIEDHLDAAVEHLNRRFGRRWVNMGLHALQRGLESILPSWVVGLVHAAEVHGTQNGFSGSQKKAYAAGLYWTQRGH